MSKKLETILFHDDEGNKNEMSTQDYIKGVIAKFEVPAEVDFGEDVGAMKATKVVAAVVTAVSNDREVADELTACESFDFTELIEQVSSDVKATISAKADAATKAAEEKEAKKKAKEEEKKRKEKEAAELAKRQEGFVKHVESGADKAQDSFLEEIKSLKDNLPKGVAISNSGNGFGIQLDEKVSDESLGQALGFFFQADQNNQFFANQIQFFIGDLASAAVEKGIFKTAMEGAKAISGYLEAQGKRMSVPSIETYRRMSTRTPIEMRNPRVDPTAYLAISQVKRPKKGDDEKKEAYEKRVKKFDDKMSEVLTKLRDGEVETRKDVLPLVQEVKYDTGIEERPDPNAEPKLSAIDLMRIYFLGNYFLENVVSIDEEGEEVDDQFAFTHNKKTIWVPKEQIREMVAEAETELAAKFIKGKNFGLKEVCQGYLEETKKVALGVDPENPEKVLTEERVVKTPALIPAFFPVAEEESDEEETEEKSDK